MEMNSCDHTRTMFKLNETDKSAMSQSQIIIKKDFHFQRWLWFSTNFPSQQMLMVRGQ
jgi:hypothetical protein